LRGCVKTGTDGEETLSDGRPFHKLAMKTGNVFMKGMLSNDQQFSNFNLPSI